MKGATPVQENDQRAQEPRASTTRFATALRALPYLLAMVVVSAPLVFAWGSFFVYYDRARGAFGDGRIFEGITNLLQLALLVVLVACVAVTFVLAGKAGKGLSTAAWRWSEGRPVLRAGLSSARFGLVSIAVVAAGVALFTWLPSREAKSEDITLKESLEEAGIRVATLLGGDPETALAATDEPEVPAEPAESAEPEGSAEPEDPAASEPLAETSTEPLPAPPPSEGRRKDPVPDRPSSEKNAKEVRASDPVPAAPVPASPAVDEAASVAPEEPVPESAAPLVIPEEPAAPSEPEVTPEPPPEALPPGDEAPPEDDAPPGTTVPDLPKTPPEDDVPPEVPSEVPPSAGEPTLP